MRACHRVLLLLALSVLWLGASGGRAGAQPAADHQYTSADIEAGSRLYANQCSLCHGRTATASTASTSGAAVPPQRVRRGPPRIITSGIAAAGMPGFKFQPAELDGADRVHPRRLRSRAARP